MSGTDGNVDWTTVYEALAHDRRQELLRYLAYTSGPMGLRDLANHLVVEEDGNHSDAQLERVHAELHHVHLPKLFEADLVRWEDDGERLSLTPLVYHLPLGVLLPQVSNKVEATSPRRVGD